MFPVRAHRESGHVPRQNPSRACEKAKLRAAPTKPVNCRPGGRLLWLNVASIGCNIIATVAWRLATTRPIVTVTVLSARFR